MNSTQRIPVARVAVVGGGVGGATAAYFLREMVQDRIDIHVYEKDHLGGRARSFEYEGKIYELGASIAYHGNRYIRDLTDEVGLKRHKLRDDGTKLMIFDGQKFVFQEGMIWPLTAWRIVKRYGMVPLSFGRYAKKVFLKHFIKIYQLQDNGEAYDHPEELLKAVELHTYTQESAKEIVQAQFGKYYGEKRFETEMQASINRVNYNQTNDINAFAGLVSYLPAADSNLFNLEDGNNALPARLLDACNAQVHLGSTVKKVSLTAKGRFRLKQKEDERNKEKLAGHEHFDAVILATPLEASSLEFEGFVMPKCHPREFKTTVTTYVRGKLRPSYFGVKSLPRKVAITLTEFAEADFSSIAYKTTFNDGTKLYKVFSSHALTNNTLSQMFDGGQRIKEHVWQAYPRFSPPEVFAPTILTRGLYYNNALENSASAMEMSAIMGRNSALLAVKHIQSLFPETFGEVRYKRAPRSWFGAWRRWLRCLWA